LARSAQPLKAWLSPESLQPPQSSQGSVPARLWWTNGGSAELLRAVQLLASSLSFEPNHSPGGVILSRAHAGAFLKRSSFGAQPQLCSGASLRHSHRQEPASRQHHRNRQIP
jgi:hypothetical protein